MGSRLEYNDWNQSRFEGLLSEVKAKLTEKSEVVIPFEYARPASFQRYVVDELGRQGYIAYFESAMPSGSLRLIAKRNDN
jgi:hypothetical protein